MLFRSHKAFQPSVLARQLADFDVVNVGAAGTFVVRNTTSPAALRAELLRKLPFQAEIMICRSREVTDLATAGPFHEELSDPKTTRFVSVLAKRPRVVPPLPISKPAGAKWQVKVVGVPGRFALSLYRRQGRAAIYPNEVVEKSFGVSATTRNWNTISAICDIVTGG